MKFYEQKTILDLLIEKLLTIPDTRLIIATTTNPKDDPIAAKLDMLNVNYFRGSENDVLARFIDAAEAHNAHEIIRICSDNPFLSKEALEELIEISQASEADYISFNVGNTPSILTHYGFWAEYVTLSALKRVQQSTDDTFYHEHVTNYIYKHPNDFNIKWIETEESIADQRDVRLTIDTKEDFDNAQSVYSFFRNQNIKYPSIHDVLTYLSEHSQYSIAMKKEIIKNQK